MPSSARRRISDASSRLSVSSRPAAGSSSMMIEGPDATALDVSWLIELFSRHSAGGGEEDAAVRERLLAIALDGLRGAGAGPLPGPAPSAAHYERRWRHPSSVVEYREARTDVREVGG